MVWLIALGMTALVGSVWMTSLHNGLAHARNDVDRAWANVDVLLLQRADELPNLVEVCRGYARHERELFEAVARACDRLRAAPGAAARNAAEGAVDEALGRLYRLAEAYPALRADALFANLQRRITALEDEIADRRELYNATVSRYNTRLERFPDALLARTLDLKRLPLFTAAARALPSAPAATVSPATRSRRSERTRRT